MADTSQTYKSPKTGTTYLTADIAKQYGDYTDVAPAASSVAPAPVPAPTPSPAPIDVSQPNPATVNATPSTQPDINSLVGTRPSAVDPNVTEYFNPTTKQGFADPNALSTYLNEQLGGNGINSQNVFDKLKEGFNAAVASGKPAPQEPGAARSAISQLTPPTAPSTSGIESQLAQDPGYQQLLADRAEYNSVANQGKSLLDFYNKAVSDAGIPGINAELLNTQRILDGTEDDIRNEVKAANGFATESQVLSLASARNKSLIKNYNNLLATKQMAMESINNMVNLASQDRSFAMQAIQQKLQIDQQISEYRDKFVQNAKEGYQNVINAVGYQGLYDMLKDDPSSIALVEKTLGMGEGQLQGIATQLQQQQNQQFGQLVNQPFFFGQDGRTIINSATGEAYPTWESFLAAGGKVDASNVAPFPNQTQQSEKTLVMDLAAKYPDASIGLNDSLISAQAKIGNSRIYKEQVRPPISGSGGGVGVLGLTNQQIDNISPLVTQFQNAPIVQNYNTIGEGYTFAKSLNDSTTNPADDQALIYALAKALDPGSVVREGEYNTAQKYAQSLIQSYGKSVTQALAGTGFLSSDARKNIKATIESRFKAAETSYKNLYSETERRINLIGNTDKGAQLLNNYGGAFAQPSTPNSFVGPVPNQPAAQLNKPTTFWGKVGNWLWGED